MGVLRQVLADGRAREVTASGRTWSDLAPERRYWRAAYHRMGGDGRARVLVAITLEISAVQNQEDELERARRYLALLDNAAGSIGTTLDVMTTCQELADFVVPALADVAAVEIFHVDKRLSVLRPTPGRLRLLRAGMAAIPELRDSIDQFGGAGSEIEYQEDSAVPRCLAAGSPVIENLFGDEQLSRAAPTPERVAAYRAVGLHSAVAVPLTTRGSPLGVLSLLRAGDSPPSARARTSSSPARWPAGPPSTWTTPAGTPASTASPGSSSVPCSPSRGCPTGASRSRPATSPPVRARWWVATGSTPSRWGTDAISR